MMKLIGKKNIKRKRLLAIVVSFIALTVVCFKAQAISKYFKRVPPECPFFNLRLQATKKRVRRLAFVTWFSRVGAKGFEPVN